MVNVVYNGLSQICIEGFKLSKGDNFVPEMVFRKMLRYPTFQSRVTAGVFKIPAEFLLEGERKSEIKNATAIIEKSSEIHVEEINIEIIDDESKLSARKVLKLIEASGDKEFLSKIISSEKREKLVEAATQRLKFISEEK